MIGLSRFLVLGGMLLWVSAFFVGPEKSFIWSTGKWGIGLLIIGVVVRLVLFLIPSRRSAALLRKRRHGEERKCTECGRPAVPGSKCCRYHTDVMNRSDDEDSPPEPYGDY